MDHWKGIFISQILLIENFRSRKKNVAVNNTLPTLEKSISSLANIDGEI